jgi:hypothetical protein
VIKFKNKEYISYLHIYEYLSKSGNKEFLSSYNIFPHSNNLYIKLLLENKFNKKFTMKEIKEIIEDTSWQQCNSSQKLYDSNETLNHISEIRKMAEALGFNPNDEDSWPFKTIESFIEIKNKYGPVTFRNQLNKFLNFRYV